MLKEVPLTHIYWIRTRINIYFDVRVKMSFDPNIMFLSKILHNRAAWHGLGSF